jgi:2'-5' RNA ligase
MKSRHLISQILLEDHSYSCVMVPIPDELKSQLKAWSFENITDTLLFTEEEDQGRELDFHVTVKYGLIEAVPSDDLRIFALKTKPFTVSLGRITIFENERFDVVKLDIQSDGLLKLNKLVRSLSNEDKYPDYQPHCTLAYVYKGEGHRFLGQRPLPYGHCTFTADRLLFSGRFDHKETLPLGQKLS